jgi:hypothetical protein
MFGLSRLFVLPFRPMTLGCDTAIMMTGEYSLTRLKYRLLQEVFRASPAPLTPEWAMNGEAGALRVAAGLQGQALEITRNLSC